MKRGEIQQRLADTNRWWSGAGGWTRYDPDLKEAAEAPFSRPYTAGVLDDLTPGGLYVLRGPRRVGKSVEVKRTIERLVSTGAEPRRIVHMSVDGWRAADLGRLAGAAAHMTPREGPRWWFIDEITGITDGWPEQIKWLRDNDRRFRADTVVLTGSSSSRLRESVGVLAGRRGRAADPDRVLLPMGFRSFARLTTDRSLPNEAARLRIADLTPPRLAEASYEMAPWLHTLAEAWEDYLQVGGFPLAVAGRLASLVADQTLGQTKIGAVAAGKVGVIDHMEGFVLVDVSDETAPAGVGSFFLDGYARDVVTAGTIAYATDSPSGLYVFDLSRPGPPEPVGVVHAPAAPRDIEVSVGAGSRPTLIVGAGGGDLQVYDVSDPAAPRKLSSFETPGRATRVSLDGHTAYVADTEAGVQVVDLSDPANPAAAGRYETPRPARDVSAAGGLVLVVVGDSEREGHDRRVLILRRN